MSTVSDLILQSYVELGVIQDTSESISTTLRDNAFAVLNQGISRSSNSRLLIYQSVHQSLTLTAGTENYTLGTGGTLVASGLPLAVTGWASTSGNFRNGGVPISFDAMRSVAQNPTAKRSVLVEQLAADQGFPSINLKVFPVPDTTPGTLELDYWVALPQYALVSDTVTLPAGFDRFLVLMLAVDLETRFPVEGGRPELARNYKLSRDEITNRVTAILASGQAAPAA